MSEVIAGIREEELGALSLEILDYSEKISAIFERIDSAMNRLPSCLQGPSCDGIMERYKVIQSSYATVKDNLTSYSDDLIMLINKMRENDAYMSHMFDGFTRDTNNQIRNNNFNLTTGG